MAGHSSGGTRTVHGIADRVPRLRRDPGSSKIHATDTRTQTVDLGEIFVYEQRARILQAKNYSRILGVWEFIRLAITRLVMGSWLAGSDLRAWHQVWTDYAETGSLSSHSPLWHTNSDGCGVCGSC